jgi:hypothetical protein
VSLSRDEATRRGVAAVVAQAPEHVRDAFSSGSGHVRLTRKADLDDATRAAVVVAAFSRGHDAAEVVCFAKPSQDVPFLSVEAAVGSNLVDPATVTSAIIAADSTGADDGGSAAAAAPLSSDGVAVAPSAASFATPPRRRPGAQPATFSSLEPDLDPGFFDCCVCRSLINLRTISRKQGCLNHDWSCGVSCCSTMMSQAGTTTTAPPREPPRFVGEHVFRLQLASDLMLEGLPLSTISSARCRGLFTMMLADPHSTPMRFFPSRNTIGDDIRAVHRLNVEDIREVLRLASPVSVSMGVWNSHSRISMLGVVCHASDAKGRMRPILVAFVHVHCKAAVDMQDRVTALVHVDDVQSEVTGFTSDGGSNVLAACRQLAIGCGCVQVRCVLHVMHSNVVDALTSTRQTRLPPCRWPPAVPAALSAASERLESFGLERVRKQLSPKAARHAVHHVECATRWQACLNTISRARWLDKPEHGQQAGIARLPAATRELLCSLQQGLAPIMQLVVELQGK